MSLVKVLYQTVLRRPSRFFAVVAVGSLFFERTIDIGIESIYDSLNRGVSQHLLNLLWVLSSLSCVYLKFYKTYLQV